MSPRTIVLDRVQAAFWDRVEKMPSGCWEWRGPRDGFGYGVNYSELRYSERAHRTAYRWANGPIPKGKILLHACDNPPCVNPDHLTPGTRAENNADRDRKGRHVTPRREEHGMAILTTRDVLDIRSAPREYGLGLSLAKKYGVSVRTIYQLRMRSSRTWRGVR